MIPIEFLRQFRVFEYAIFDFAIVFLVMFLIAPLLSKAFLKIRLKIPKYNWLFFTLPISIIVHLLVGQFTPLTRNFIDINDHYILKVLIIILIALGIRGVKIIKK